MSRDNIRCLSDVEKDLRYWLERYMSELKAWKSVERVKKKDGTDFANMSKNFKNADWEVPTHSDSFHPELAVYATVGHKTERFWISMYEYVDEMRSDDARRDKGQRNSWMREVYILTPAEAMSAIQCRIIDVESHIKRLEAQLAKVDEIYGKFFENIIDAFLKLKDDCAEFRSDPKFPSSLEYLLFDVLENSRYTLLK